MEEAKSLKAIVAETATLEERLIESGGEINDEILKLIEVKDVKLPEKVDAYSLIMTRMDAASDWYEKRAEAFLRLAKSCENLKERLKGNIYQAMQELGTKELSGFDVRFAIVKTNPAVEIPDPKLVDPAYTKIEEVITVDKKRIAEDLKMGVEVKGASLRHSETLRVFMNSPASRKGRA